MAHDDMRLYKIVRISDGKFSTGGQVPNFTKRGRLWLSMFELRNHISLFKYSKLNVYNGCKIVVYSVTEIDEQCFSLAEQFDSFRRDAVAAKLKGTHY